LFSAAGKHFYSDITTEVSECACGRFFKLRSEFCINLIFTIKVTWYDASDWCAERGMQLPSLKTLSQVQAVENELRNSGYRKQKIDRDIEIKIETFCSVTGNHWFWVSASDIGRTPHGQYQWADGTPVDRSTWYSGQPDDARAGKETCVYLRTGYTPNWATTPAQTLCTSSARFLLRSPRALNNQMHTFSPQCPRTTNNPRLSHANLTSAHLWKERPTFWCWQEFLNHSLACALIFWKKRERALVFGVTPQAWSNVFKFHGRRH
jgi:hypothetical protein